MTSAEPEDLPKVGEWYLEADTEDEFQVIDVDSDEGMVEVQYFDGNIDAFTLADWKALAPQPIDAPEDWTGPMDSLEADDVDYDEEPSEHSPPRRRRIGVTGTDRFPFEAETDAYGPFDGGDAEDD